MYVNTCGYKLMRLLAILTNFFKLVFTLSNTRDCPYDLSSINNNHITENRMGIKPGSENEVSLSSLSFAPGQFNVLQLTRFCFCVQHLSLTCLIHVHSLVDMAPNYSC